MRAAIIHEYGGSDRIEAANMPDPTPGPGEVVVKVHAAALNHLDIWVRGGRPGDSLQMPHILGSDAAGVVHAVGEGVSRWQPGAAVMLNPGLSCGACEACHRGEQSECASFGIVGLSSKGSFAEYVCVPASNLAPVPAHLNDHEAAALPLAHLTAWRMVFSRARVQPGETVLVHGIGGGVALAALQFIVHAGGRAIVTSSSVQKLGRAQDMGAAGVIDYANDNVAEAVADQTNGRGVDAVIDAVGAATFGVNLAVARKGGRIVHCGVTTGGETAANISTIYAKHLTIMGSTMGSHEEFRLMAETVQNTGMRPVIDQVFPLDQVRSATDRMENGDQFGKIVLDLM